jgi:hypothetical protein
LFNEQIVNEQVRSTLVDNWIDFSSQVFGTYLENQKISFEFSLGTNIEIRSGKLKSDKSADIFVVLVKHIDKKWPQIVQAFRNKILEIPGEAWKEIQALEKASELTEDDRYQGEKDLNRMIEEYNKKHKDLFRFLAFMSIFVLPVAIFLFIGFISVKIEGENSGNSGGSRCSDHIGSYDC